jgi:hypothetical protein
MRGSEGRGNPEQGIAHCFRFGWANSALKPWPLRRGGLRFMGQQQRYHLYQQQRRREPMLEGRDDSVLDSYLAIP